MKNILIITAMASVLSACGGGFSGTTTPTTPDFTIITNTDSGFSAFNRKIVVFDIPIYAVAAVEDTKLLHAANLMAQYLDNNEDGVIDNSTIHNSMVSNKAFLFMWKTEAERDAFNPPDGFVGQDLGADETIPAWHTNGHTGRFDAALEEVWHIVTNGGYERAYPTIFSSQIGSSISNAMDIARGGFFQDPPARYPADAWYTYSDSTCDYNCQVGEYLYWVMTSMLGAQANRLTEINDEWKLNTRALVESTDSSAFALFTNPAYIMPTVLPDGTYNPAVRSRGIFTVLADNATIEMNGVIGSTSLRDFNALYAEFPAINTINIKQCDGSEDDQTNLRLSTRVNQLNINTHLLDNGVIASGGVDFFLAGPQRTRGVNTRIGVHAWSDGGSVEATDFPVGHTNHLPYINYYVSIGFTQQQAEDFYYFTINAAPANSIHWMTDTEVMTYNIVTQ